MRRTEWFQRKFPPIEDNGLLPAIIERLAGTTARLKSKLLGQNITFAAADEGKWSIKAEIGHLGDLEPLWTRRARQIINGGTYLEVTDITNQQTFDANHDAKSIEELILRFETERNNLLEIIRNVADDALENSALHPRLKTPMRLVDHAYFIAEHDDHHLAQITFLMG